ncbi:hypothetical protein PISMIDRAFT_680935 [Pisolithus microcarpus 441]|uniref:Uncharacterized protein n=1 Tax=Pisolithus microcarpus 441 TaxID=765257 RepID=A0A0C9YYG0_9AGAM|nr:hypothetical protein PISMIDRAFT_680935 [Pisolithus microcarpus 441]
MTGTRKTMTTSHTANDMAYAAAAALPLTTHHPASATPHHFTSMGHSSPHILTTIYFSTAD